MAWTGQVSFGVGWAAYRGQADQQHAHAHGALQLVVATRGNVVVELGSKTIAGPGILLAPRVKHLTRASKTSLVFLYVEPQSPLGRSLTAALESRSATAVAPPEVAALRRHDDIQEAIRHLGAKEAGTALDVRLAHALRSLEEPADARGAVAEAARAVGLSVSRLRTIAQTELGLPLAQWIIWRKIAKAGVALSRGESLAQAALIGGFADQAHLTRTMRRMFGVTPGAMLGSVRRGAFNARGETAERPPGRAKSNPSEWE